MKVFVILALVLTASPAYAYIDPGTGSFIIQGVIGAIATAFFTTKLYWQKLINFFFGKKPLPEVTENNNTVKPESVHEKN